MAEEQIRPEIRKRAIALFVAIGVFLLWLGLILVKAGGGSLRDPGVILGVTGSLFAFVVALAGALGSKRTTDHQNLGLLIVAAALLLVAVQLVFPG
ncbi:MAG: hypothetical protein ACE5LS_08185 [Thermoplasmata archaeon]